MLSARIPAIKNQVLISIGLFVLGLWLAWQLGGRIANEDLRSIEFAAMAIAACVVAVVILRNWRSGFYLFLVWMLFEDLPRKYLGNGTILFFGKDVLVGLTFISLLVAIRKRREKVFRPPFLAPLGLFVWLAAAQIFNPNSPSFLYGLLGFKLYFYYIPLIFVGYALIRSDDELRKFLLVNAAVAGVIALLGITQAIRGNSFLNPAHLAPELEDLGNLYKASPLTGRTLSLPDSVFVSSGRFAIYMLAMSILMIGTAGYLVLHTKKSRKIVFLVIGLVGGGVLLAGSRGAVMYSTGSALVMTVAFLWGAPWRQRQAHRSLKAVYRSLSVAALALAAIILIFPEETGSRIALYAETLLPSSSAYEVNARVWSYPVDNLLAAFDNPHWGFGNGTGTASLGEQYVSKFLGRPPLRIGVEEGYGQMIIEMGVLAPIIWILWSAALLYQCWKVVRQLRGTRFFPIAFAIFWYALLLLYPFTWGGLAAYQNFVCNIYLWLLVGILFRLPDLLVRVPVPVEAPSRRPRRGGFQF
jgi:hypothetical protein